MDFDSGNWRRADTPTMEFRQPAPQLPPPPPAPPREPGHGGANWFTLLSSAVVSALVAAVVTLGVTDGFGGDGTRAADTPAVQEAADVEGPPVAPPAEDGGSIAEVAKTVLPSTVRVNVSGPEGTGNGSGVVYAADGLIVTNNHVVDGATQIEVQLSDGTLSDAEVVGTDPLSDLALLRIERGGLPVPEYASVAPDVGVTAIAIGSPFGLDSTVTAGIVSATARTLPGAAQGQPDLVGLIQTDAAINPGNSGGALLNDQGQVIGINTAIYSNTQQNAGIGFAVPVETVLDVAQDLLEVGAVEYAYLGVAPQPVTPDVAEQFDLGTSSGAIVAEVVPGSPADGAGLRPGDIITRIDDAELTPNVTLQAVLRDFAPGDQVTVTYLRDGNSEQAVVTLAERPSQE